MNEIIYKRRSVRKFENSELDSDTLKKIQDIIDKAKPLFPDASYSVEIGRAHV